MPESPDVIIQVSDVSARTQNILPNLDHIANLPIDGISVNIPASWSTMTAGYVTDEDDLAYWLDPLVPLNEALDRNYILVVNDDPGDLFDDAAWVRAIENWKRLADAAERTGFHGIVFDNEEYFDPWHDYPEDYRPGVADLEAYQAQSSLRGRQIAEAVGSVWADAEIAVMHGPYMSTPPGLGAPGAMEAQYGSYDQHELAGPFFTGLLEGLGPGMRLVDGGELYQLRSAEEFRQSATYRGETLPGLFPWAVEPNALASYDARVDQGHMVYTDEFPPGSTQDPDSFRATLTNALDTSEGLVMVYSEIERFGWLAPETLPAAWREALEGAVADAAAEESDSEPEPQPQSWTLIGARGDDKLRGGDGNDDIDGQKGDDRLFGRSGDDVLKGGKGDDRIRGGAGDDLIGGGKGDDRLQGDSGDDLIGGGKGDDRLLGGAGDDLIRGGKGDDRLLGGAGDDFIWGGKGDDRLQGGVGDDLIWGGKGDDRFVFRLGDGDDVILDFDPGTDVLHLPGTATESEDAGDVVYEWGGGSVRLEGGTDDGAGI